MLSTRVNGSKGTVHLQVRHSLWWFEPLPRFSEGMDRAREGTE